MRLKKYLYIHNPGLYYSCFKFLTYCRTFFFRKNVKKYISKQYKKKFNTTLDLDCPRTFYDKVNYCNINYYSKLNLKKYVDKSESKKIISEAAQSDEFVAKTLGLFDDYKTFKQFLLSSEFPKKCVIKLTHTSGVVFFCVNNMYRDKFGCPVSLKQMLKCIKKMINYNHYYFSFEFPYKKLGGKILIEEYLDFNSVEGLNEYKIFCNYGEPKLINVVYGRQVEYKGNASECFTDAKLNILNAKQSLDLISQDKLIIPTCFQEMINICKKVTVNFPMIRVDFLVYKNNFYFCEFTFVDCAGMAIFEPKEANYMIGDMFDLQENKR